MTALLLAFSGLLVADATVLYIDMNNAPQEYGACMEGAGDDNVAVVSRDTVEGGHLITPAYIERKMQELEAIGQPADTVILSCHQGAGLCFGENGEISSTQLTQILDRHPRTKRNVKSLGMINCYGGNVDAAEEQWLLPNSGVSQIFGFPTQSPKKTAPDTATLVKDFCRNRQEYARATSKEDLCQVYPKIASLTKQTVALCSREAIAARAYGAKTCYSYEDLHRRCAEFDPGEQTLVKYMNYLHPDDPCGPYANPPSDKNSAYEGGASPLRGYYNQIHLWRHCVKQIRADRGYDMPQATNVIRLIKYDTIKENLARLNARELADYDRRLHDLCLDQFKLGDITGLSRADMNGRIEGAVKALSGGGTDDDDDEVSRLDGDGTTSAREPARAADGSCRPPVRAPAHACAGGPSRPDVVAKMARMLKQTFVDLDSRSNADGSGRSCVHFHLVEEGAPARYRSECIVDYRTAASL